jgi:predicted small lipoprotein YifL
MKRARGVVCLMLILVALALAGCGKKNAPQPPPNVPNTYPRTYPRE